MIANSSAGERAKVAEPLVVSESVAFKLSTETPAGSGETP